MAIKSWKVLSSKIVFNSKWYTLRQDTIELPTGQILDDYYVSVRPDVAIVFALTSDKQVIMVRQYKHGVQRVTLELPAGTFKTGSAIEAAKRELMEETGYECGDLRQIGTIFDDSSKNSNLVHVFLGTDTVQTGHQELEITEEAGGFEIELLPVKEVIKKVRSGEIAAQSSVVSIYRALDELRSNGLITEEL